MGTDKFFIQPKGQMGPPGSTSEVKLTSDDMEAIKKVKGVKEVSGFVVANAKIEFNDETRYVLAIGMDSEAIDLFFESGSYKIDEGRLMKSNDIGSVMLGSQYKYNKYFSKPIKVGNKVKINDKEFNVKTILQSIGNPQDDRQVYMLEEDVRTLFNIPKRIDAIIVQIEAGENIKDIAEKTDKKLMNKHDVNEKTKDFTILTPEELLATFGTILNILTGFLLGIAAISLVVGGIGIATTMYTSVLERTREIGVMKAVGAQNKDILAMFAIESGLLGAVGGTIGILLGYGISKLIEYIAANQLGTSMLKTSSPLYLIIGCLLFSFIIGALSGIWPSRHATRIKPVEALRYE
jgi:putative ABC transport system permease protein